MLAMLAAVATATQPAEPYRAHGTDPAWSLTIQGRELTYVPANGRTVSGTARTTNTDETGRFYATRGLSVSIMLRSSCADRASGNRYADTVFVTVAGRELMGCGGAMLAADDLADTSWHFVEIAGEAIPLTGDLLRDDGYAIDFGADGFVGYGGCNRIGGRYTRAGDMLTVVPPLMSTRRACDEPVMRREQRLLQILSAPVRISLPDPNTLLLTGESDSVRLRRTSADYPETRDD